MQENTVVLQGYYSKKGIVELLALRRSVNVALMGLFAITLLFSAVAYLDRMDEGLRGSGIMMHCFSG